MIANGPLTESSYGEIEPEEGARMDKEQRIVAVGLLTERDLALLGEGFRRAFPLDGRHDFTALLSAIDEADRQHGPSEAVTKPAVRS